MENVFYLATFIQRPTVFTIKHFVIHVTVVLSHVLLHFIISFLHCSRLFQITCSATPPHTSSQMQTNNITWILLAIFSISHSTQDLLNQEKSADSVYEFFQGIQQVLTLSLCIRWIKMWG